MAKQRHGKQVDARGQYNGEKNKAVSRLILHPKLSNPISPMESSLELKMARKVSKRSKRDLRGLWKTLAPGSTVVRTSLFITDIKETNVSEVKFRNADIAQFGPQAEQNTDLLQYAQRRLHLYNGTTEKKIALHSKEWKKT